MADNRTMAQMLQAPIEGYEDAIVVPPINANNFELQQTLINLVQSNQFTRRQDPHNHLRFFNKSLAFLTVDNADEMTTGSWLFSWRKAYSRFLGNSFNLCFYGSTLDGFNRLSRDFHWSGSTSSVLGLKETASTSSESSSSSSLVYFPSWFIVSTHSLAVVRKGLLKMIRTSSSSSISKTMKSIGKINLLIFTNRFLQTPMGLREATHPLHPFSASLIWTKRAYWMTWKIGKRWMAKGLSDVDRGGAGKGGSWVLTPDLVVMVKVGALVSLWWGIIILIEPQKGRIIVDVSPGQAYLLGQRCQKLVAVVVRDFYKKFYNSPGRVPNRCSGSKDKTWGLLSLSRGIEPQKRRIIIYVSPRQAYMLGRVGLLTFISLVESSTRCQKLVAVVVRDFYKKFYNSPGRVPNRCSGSKDKT
nr:reverse transcriptase domain-containing protein [Tanacetum cinerariifolium]